MAILTSLEQTVLALIPRGTESKIQLSDIAKMANIEKRTVYSVVSSLVKKGVPVVAKRAGEPQQRGYYIAETEAELIDGIQGFQEQIKDMQDRLQHIKCVDLKNWHKKVQ